MKLLEEVVTQLNDWGKKGIPFGFLLDYKGEKPVVFPLERPDENIFWAIPDNSRLEEISEIKSLQKWETFPVIFNNYKLRFYRIQQAIHNGDTYLLNLTQPTPVETNLTPEEIFYSSSALYKIYYRNHFVCFSPETFVKIRDGKIYSYPMKGTIDASIKNASQQILEDSKEIAEHNTIVDLIRNDMCLVAENVTVEKFRFLSHIKANKRNLWQVSSEISGDLSENYSEKIGDILAAMLPAGSVTGAPKRKRCKLSKKLRTMNVGITPVFSEFLTGEIWIAAY